MLHIEHLPTNAHDQVCNGHTLANPPPNTLMVARACHSVADKGLMHQRTQTQLNQPAARGGGQPASLSL